MTTSKPSIRVVKHMAWRGETKTWSNRYYVTPDVPSTDAQWNDLADAVVAGEKAMLPSYIHYDEVVCYAAGSEVPVHTRTASGDGGLTVTGSNPTPGDSAALIRYSTDARTSKNHPIYLFNYYHGARYSSSGDNDTLWAAMKSAMETFAGNMVSGGWVAGKSYKRCGPHGAVALGSLVETYITHRDFRK